MILITYDMHVELMVYCYLIMIPEWSLSPSGVSLGPFSQVHTFRYLDVIMLLFLGDILLVFGFDSVVDMDDWDYTFDDG